MAVLGSKEWIENSRKAYESMPELQELAKAIDLELGIRLRAEEEKGLAEDLNIILKLGGGDISVRFASNEIADSTPVIVTMDYETGKGMLTGKKDLTQLYMAGKIKVTKGDLMDLAKYSAQLPKVTAAMKAIMGDTRWPDELSPAEREAFSESMKETFALNEIKLS